VRQFRGRVKNVSGTTSLVVARDDDLGADPGFTGSAAVEADATNQALVVKVTAGASLTRWVASIRTVVKCGSEARRGFDRGSRIFPPLTARHVKHSMTP
jgi:hypothetical protein